MTFILSKDFSWKRDHEGYDHTEFTSKWETYRTYLRDLKGKVPDSTYEFANAEWHYNNHDARCPHDAWLEEVKFGEISECDGKFNLQAFDIKVRLLGAYHNGHIELLYKNVYHYSFDVIRQSNENSFIKSAYHADWRYDEIRSTDDGHVIHEIEWVLGHWLIECDDIQYTWLPFDPDAPTQMSP